MSQENVEIAERAIDAYNRRDLHALRSLNDPNVEFDWSASEGPEAGVYRGIDAVMRLHAAYFDVFAEISIEPECFIDTGESVVVPNGSRSMGRDGIEVHTRGVAFTFTIRNGRIARFCLYQDKDEALKAVGLEQ
jgi:ketosteroid isomerase-like protein